MDALDKIYSGLNEHPTALMLTLALLAIAWMFKDQRARDAAHAAELAALNKSLLETALRVVPAIDQVVKAVEVLERITNASLQRQASSGGGA